MPNPIKNKKSVFFFSSGNAGAAHQLLPEIWLVICYIQANLNTENNI